MADTEAALNEPAKIAQIIRPLHEADIFDRVHLNDGASASLVLGVSALDDCAAFEMNGRQMLVAGSDYVRGPKFHLYETGHLNNFDIGWYLAGANLSDVAAMGAFPLGVLSVVRYPKDLPDNEFSSLIEGIRDCCASVGALNVGGDVGTAERIILSASAFGTVEPDGMLRRDGAHAGQIVCLTGPTGLAGAGLGLSRRNLQTAVSDQTWTNLLQKWRRVTPRFAHGRVFARSSGVTSCIDTSDGLRGALEALATSSGVGMEIRADQLPLDPYVVEAAHALAIDPWELVFGDSVDFELVCTVDASDFSAVRATCLEAGVNLFNIGIVSAARRLRFVESGVTRPLPGTPWSHTA